MFTRMQTPRTRAEFERAFHFAVERKFGLPMGADDYLHSILSVRKLPNGRIDFLSVDERARLHANMSLNTMEGPLSDILREQSDLRTLDKGNNNVSMNITSTNSTKKKGAGKKTDKKKATNKKRKEKKKNEKRKKKEKKKKKK